MVPVGLAWLGLSASILLIVGLPLRLVGFLERPIAQLIWIPMALFEIPLSVWFMVKGVRASVARGR
jgi:hypothetical protein